MKHSEALLTAARTYCQKNYYYWYQKYKQVRAESQTPENYSKDEKKFSTIYNCLEAIQLGLETIVGNDFKSLDDARKKIIDLGKTSHTKFTKDEKGEIQTKTMISVRNKFVEYVESLSDEDLQKVEPIPYRKRLVDQAVDIRKKLKEEWNFDGKYWEPLTTCSPKPWVFLSVPNLSPEDRAAITNFVKQIGEDHVYLIAETRLDYQIPKSDFELDLYEVICCDDTFSWIIYGSHDATLAFAGEPLLGFVKKQFVDREALLNAW